LGEILDPVGMTSQLDNGQKMQAEESKKAKHETAQPH
jgi:hypothetical protein